MASSIIATSVGRQSQWWSDLDTWKSHANPIASPRITPYWDFLLAATNSKSDFQDLSGLGLNSSSYRTAGAGATCVVQIGKTIRGKLVAVKIDRAASQPLQRTAPGQYEQNLSQLAKELRLLSDEKLRQNSHVIDLLGFGIESFGGSLSCFLVTEYCELGDLRHFLKMRWPVSVHQKLDFCRDIAHALKSLHQLNICHGDVKLENALVSASSVHNHWHLKLCDFSHAQIGQGDGPDTMVRPTIGTRLLCAPELYQSQSSSLRTMSISQAIATDVFSYGLLIWELFKHGESFFNDAWLKDSSIPRGGANVEAKEDFMLSLHNEELCELAVESLTILMPGGDKGLELIIKLIYSTLTYNFKLRLTICDLTPILGDDSHKSDEYVSKEKLDRPKSTCHDAASAVMQASSIREIFNFAFENSCSDMDSIPFAFRRNIVEDLKRIESNPDMAGSERAKADMLLSECYVHGLGVSTDSTMMLYWLHRAAILGSRKAAAWYHRVNIAINVSPAKCSEATDGNEFDIAWLDLPSEDYLLARIRHFQHTRKIQALRERQSFTSGALCTEISAKSTYRLPTFNEDQQDELSLLHLAAFGDSKALHNLDIRGISKTTKFGRNLLFYTCFAGDIVNLRYLIECQGAIAQDDHFRINPLHLCIFFDSEEVEEAVSTLLEAGANIESSSDFVFWEDHDIGLFGTAIEWAVHCRHLRLAQVLLQHGAVLMGLDIAVSLFYYEIIDFMLEQDDCSARKEECLSAINAVDRSFRHWISHGKDHLHAISRTFDVLQSHHVLINSQILPAEDGNLPISVIQRTCMSEDFETIRQLVTRGQDIKHKDGMGLDLLGYAIQRSGQDEAWAPILDFILDYFTVEELEGPFLSEESYLHHAIKSDSVVGAKALLRKGVNIDLVSEDELGYTPLLYVVSGDKSFEMMDLLLSHGASIEPAGFLRETPLQTRLGGLQRTGQLVDKLLEHYSLNRLCVRSLHSTFDNVIGEQERPDKARNDRLEGFRHIIGNPSIRKILDEPDPAGPESSLLHKAASLLQPYLVQLLIEAGADVTRTTRTILGDLNALQIAAENARALCYFHLSDPLQIDGTLGKSRQGAFQVTYMILSEHQSQQDIAFQGISPLHIAAKTGDLESVRNLIASHPEAKHTMGRWPGYLHKVKPCDLISLYCTGINPYLTLSEIQEKSKLSQPQFHFEESVQELNKAMQEDPTSFQDMSIEREHFGEKPFTLCYSWRRVLEHITKIWDLVKVE